MNAMKIQESLPVLWRSEDLRIDRIWILLMQASPTEFDKLSLNSLASSSTEGVRIVQINDLSIFALNLNLHF